MNTTENNLIQTTRVIGTRLFPGEPVLYSFRRLLIRPIFDKYAKKAEKIEFPAALHTSHTIVLPRIIPPAQSGQSQIDEAKKKRPKAEGRETKSSMEDLIDPKFFDRRSLVSITNMPNEADTGSLFPEFLNNKKTVDMIIAATGRIVRDKRVTGISLDIRFAGDIDGGSYMALLKRLKSLVGKKQHLIVSVPGEVFFRQGVRRKFFKSYLAGFDIDDILKLVDVMVIRCFKDPVIWPDDEKPFAGIDWVRNVLDRAVHEVPCWRLMAGFMCGSVLSKDLLDGRKSGGTLIAVPEGSKKNRRGSAKNEGRIQPVKEIAGMNEFARLTRRFIVRKKYDPKEGSTIAAVANWGNLIKFWVEDDRSVANKLQLANRFNLLGIELFWPDMRQEILWRSIADTFNPLQESEGW